MRNTHRLLIPLVLLVLLIAFVPSKIEGQTASTVEQLLAEAKSEEKRIASMSPKHKKELEKKHADYLVQIEALHDEMEYDKCVELCREALPIVKERYGRLLDDHYTNLQTRLSNLLISLRKVEEYLIVKNDILKNNSDQFTVQINSDPFKKSISHNPSAQQSLQNIAEGLEKMTNQLIEAPKTEKKDTDRRTTPRLSTTNTKHHIDEAALDRQMKSQLRISNKEDYTPEELAIEAKEQERKIAEMNPDYKKRLEEKYEVYLKQINAAYEKDYDKTIVSIKKALPIAKERYGRLDDNFIQLLTMLGQILQKKGEYETAEIVMRSRMKNQNDQMNIGYQPESAEDFFTDENGNPSIGGIIDIFQDLANAATQLEEANKKMKEEPAIRNIMRATTSYIEKAIEDNHLDEGMEFKHIIPEVLGKNEEAVAEFKEKIETDGLNILQNLPYLAEETQRQWVTMYFNDLEIFQSYLNRNGSDDQDLVEAILNHQFKIKGFLSASKTALLAEIKSMDKTTQELYQKWHAKNIWISQQLAMDAIQQSGRLELERKNAQILENELAKKSKAFSTNRKHYQIKDIQEKLKAEEAYIEFVHFDYWNTFQWTDSILYAAYIIKPEEIQFVPLFEERELAISPFVEKNVKWNYVSRGGIKVGENNKHSFLEKILLGKLLPYLNSTSTIYFSPSGKLHQFNLAAFPKLSEKFKLHQLITHRSLFDDKTIKANLKRALVIGGIDYNYYSKTSSGNYEVVANKDEPWQPLPGTKEEAISIKQLLSKNGIGSALAIERSANEVQLKTLSTNGQPPNILHIGTHGYFYPALKNGEKGNNRFESSTDPLIRSGLIFAGANGNWKKQKKHPDEDGILTAKEITNFFLNTTELVVLSACETGLGQVDESEGVYGLQRAFKIAGAKYIIMSLWKVPDEATKELMLAFYKNWLTEKQSIPTAFREAQEAMKKRYDNPKYWAGFVLTN